jgi:hypothetical protein
MLTLDLAISGIVSVRIIKNVIYESADVKNYAPSFKNTIVIDRMNCCVRTVLQTQQFILSMTIVFLKEGA